MRKIILRTVAWIILALAVIAIFAAVAYALSPIHSPPLVVVGTLVGTPGVGLPAIHHYGKGTPTPDEVRKFVLSHQFPGGPTTTGQPPTILGIGFITAKAASAKLQGALRGESIGLPDTATVIYVELRGPFAISNTLPSYAKKPMIVQNAVEVFDAATGNLLFYWPS